MGTGAVVFVCRPVLLASSVGVIRRTFKRLSVGMSEDLYQALKIKHRFLQLSRAKQKKRPFVTDFSETTTFGDFLQTF